MTTYADKETKPVVGDRAAILKAMKTLAEPGQVVELRALGATTEGNPRPHAESGYFDDHERLADAVAEIQTVKGAYITLNPVRPVLLARVPNQIRPAEKGLATQDTDIVHRRWLPIDIDPKRLAGTSSTSDELKSAAELRNQIARYLKKKGFPEPVTAISGNGLHMLYRIDLPTEDCGLVRRSLAALANRFDNDYASVDRTVFNPARIWRLYGTRACKGAATSERPHRMAKIMGVPDTVQIVPLKALKALAAELGGEESAFLAGQPVVASPYDVAAFIAAHGLDVDGPHAWNNQEGNGRRWILKASPMCEHHDGAAFIAQLGNGAIQAGCHHNSCSWTWADLRARFERNPTTSRAKESPTTIRLPELHMPGDRARVTDTAREAGRLLGATGSYFARGRTLTAMRSDHDDCSVLEIVSPTEFISVIESVAQPVKWLKGEKLWSATVLTRSQADAILVAESFQRELPPIRGLTHCPILTERFGELIEVVGYNRATGIYARGRPAETIPLETAKQLLAALIGDFHFSSPADRSRALAALITPALVFGGLLPKRAPAVLVEADQPQTGKGYFVRMIAAIYADVPASVAKNNSGVGSLDENFDTMLTKGRSFICLDNLRGSFNSQKIESFCTEDQYLARVPYQPTVEIDPHKIILLVTSNAAEFTQDFSNRMTAVSLMKQRPGYPFTLFQEGDLLAHVRTNQPRYLGAVHSVVRAWHSAGKPRSSTFEHDFREWCAILDWIVTNLLAEAPLMDGHRQIQKRTANRHLSWLRVVAHAANAEEKLGQWLRPNGIFEIIQKQGGIEIPGLTDGANVEDEDTRNKIYRAIGTRMGPIFDKVDLVEVDGYVAKRRETFDDKARPKREYQFSRATPASATQVVPA